MDNIQRLTYTNHTATNTRLIIEPWAEEFVIRPEQQVGIIVESDAPGILDMQ
ncbi:MAG: hypothetical protein V4505_22340 [Pseudomonadota bacterium]